MDAAGTTWVGIDVSKATLDCHQHGPGRPRGRAFPNTPAGFRRQAAWADPDARFCLESTGAYAPPWPTTWPPPAGTSRSSTRPG